MPRKTGPALLRCRTGNMQPYLCMLGVPAGTPNTTHTLGSDSSGRLIVL